MEKEEKLKDIKLRKECGLFPTTSINEDGDQEWLGTQKQWNDYENRLEGDNRSQFEGCADYPPVNDKEDNE